MSNTNNEPDSAAAVPTSASSWEIWTDDEVETAFRGSLPSTQLNVKVTDDGMEFTVYTTQTGETATLTEAEAVALAQWVLQRAGHSN